MVYMTAQEILNIVEFIHRRSCLTETDYDYGEILAEVRGELAILKKLLNGDFIKVDGECNNGKAEE